MKLTIVFFLVYAGSIGAAFAQIDKENLYDRYWHIESDDIVKPTETIKTYNRFEKQNLYDFRSLISIYKRDGSKSGFNAAGKPYSNTWKFIPPNKITSGNDRNAAEILKLTDKEFIVEVRQTYIVPLTGEQTPIIWRTKYVSFDPCVVYETLKSGDWNDPAIWTCQKVPTINDKVQVNKNHKIIIPSNYKAYARSVLLGGDLDIKHDAELTTQD